MNSINKKSCLTSTSHAVDRSTINFDKNELIQISNHQFITELFRGIPENAYAAVCTKPGNPEDGGWKARPIKGKNLELPIGSNNYICCSSFYLTADGSFNVRKENFHAIHFLLLDDVGTKIQPEQLAGFEPSWVLETSPGNHQAGIVLKEPIIDREEAMRLTNALVKCELTDPGASGISRWARLPNGINGKPNYLDDLGNSFACKLVSWNPGKRYTTGQIEEWFRSIPPSPMLQRQSHTTLSNPGKVDKQKLAKLKSLLSCIDPDIAYPTWVRVLMAVFNETQGSEEGFALVNTWSSSGQKYRGDPEIKLKWRSFRHGIHNPVTIATLYEISRCTNFQSQLDVPSTQFDEVSEANTSEPHVIHKNTLDNPHRLEPLSFPDKPSEGSRGIPATIPNVKHLLNSYGISVRYNTVRKKLMITIPGYSGMPDNADNSAFAQIISLATLNNMQTGQLKNYIGVIADRNPYNPIADWINSKPWDGKDRIQEICDTLVQRPDFPEELKKILAKKWLLSVVAAALKPNGFKSRGVLTLQGAQSIGKTAWINALVPDEALREIAILLDHHLDAGNKDSIITAISHWIVEIGELDSSFKKDIARLKGFLTSDRDKVRRPYGMTDSEYPRRTVFCATVNDHNFLVDSTGNTRWWTIPVISVNYEHNIDMQQVFAQLAVDYNNGLHWWLTRNEEKLLEKHNADHRIISVIREKVLEYIDPARMNESNQPAMKAIDVLFAIGIDRPSNSQCKECAAVLRELLGDPKRIKGENKWRIPKREENFTGHYGESDDN